MDRRDFLGAAAGAATALGPAAITADRDDSAVRAYFRSCLRTRQQVEDFVATDQTPERRERNQGWIYDAELGWVLTDSVRRDGVDGSKTFYHYGADGARKVVNSPDRPWPRSDVRQQHDALRPGQRRRDLADHFRNLDSWRTLRFGQHSRCGFTLPHLRVDVAKGVCTRVENPLGKREDVRGMMPCFP